MIPKGSAPAPAAPKAQPKAAKKPTGFKEGDRVEHASRGGGTITAVAGGEVTCLYDNEEEFEYSLEDALSKLTLAKGAAAKPAKANATVAEPAAAPAPARPKKAPVKVDELRGSTHTSHGRVSGERSTRPAVTRRASPNGTPLQFNGTADNMDIQNMEFPIPDDIEGVQGTINYWNLVANFNNGPRTDSGEPLPVDEDTMEWNLDELTMGDPERPSKTLKNPIPLQTLITHLGTDWSRDNVL